MAEINFFWDPLSDNILQERDETGAVTAEYTAEPGLYGNVISQNRDGVESQFHYDAQGSTLAVTDDNQNVTDTFAYTAFGEVTERTGTTEVPFQYIGQKGYYTDGLTGQIMARRRPYEPTRGRWQSADPLRAFSPRFAGEARQQSCYSYAVNRPTFYSDASGMAPPEPGSTPPNPVPPRSLPPQEQQVLADILSVIDTLARVLILPGSLPTNPLDIIAGRSPDYCRWVRVDFKNATNNVRGLSTNDWRCPWGSVISLGASFFGLNSKLTPLFPRVYSVQQCAVGACDNWSCSSSKNNVATLPFGTYPYPVPALAGGWLICNYSASISLTYDLNDCTGECVSEPRSEFDPITGDLIQEQVLCPRYR